MIRNGRSRAVGYVPIGQAVVGRAGHGDARGTADVYREMVSLGAGCGLRQGEIFGLAVEDIDFLGGVLRVTRQVKLIRSVQAVFGPPKGGKERYVPLPESVAAALEA
ncbi:tyrosine-type recombinase/integrase [Streptomyces albidoflavus]